MGTVTGHEDYGELLARVVLTTRTGAPPSVYRVLALRGIVGTALSPRETVDVSASGMAGYVVADRKWVH